MVAWVVVMTHLPDDWIPFSILEPSSRAENLSMIVRKLVYSSFSTLAQLNAWVHHGREYSAPIRPDRIIWLDPQVVQRKSATKPPSNAVRKPLVVGGEWDRELVPFADDIVYEALFQHFEEGASWERTGYVEFLSTGVSEHGNVAPEKAFERCRKLDSLYSYLSTNGYRSQSDLERTGELLHDFEISILPPRFREIAVNITRDGEFVWDGGIHRLVMAQLLDVDRIPVRVNIRHRGWQVIREAAYNGIDVPAFHDHEDVEYLLR